MYMWRMWREGERGEIGSGAIGTQLLELNRAASRRVCTARRPAALIETNSLAGKLINSLQTEKIQTEFQSLQERSGFTSLHFIVGVRRETREAAAAASTRAAAAADMFRS